MIGHELGGRYEILSRIGGGGMALVYKANDVLLNRKVAVKILRQQFVHDEEFIQRFRREAQSAAALSHPNVVSIYDVGQEGDTHYIVMEYIEGRNLNEIIKDYAPLQVDEAVGAAIQICDALDHAHHNHIIHRDIKPHNILIGNNGRVKVTDFGIARAVTSSTITHTGSVIGSVHYFSPEHAKGINAGEKSDLYSLGIVLYQMLTGQLPFLGESPISVALKHLQETFEEPRKVNPRIPQSVENIILKAMRKNPSERYASAREMMQDLETCLSPERIHEPKINFHASHDMDETIVMPAIRSEAAGEAGGKSNAGALRGSDMGMASSASVPQHTGVYQTGIQGAVEQTAEQNGEISGESGKTVNKWRKPLIVAGITLLFLVILIIGFRWFLDRMKVEDVEVPYVINQTLEDAKRMLEEKKLGIEDPIIEEFNKEFPAGIVLDQSKKHMKVKTGSRIQLTVSKGIETKEMKDFVNSKLQDAIDELYLMGVNEKQITVERKHADEEKDTILKQSLRENEPFDPEEVRITFVVSDGLEPVEMPDLVNLDLNRAKSLMKSLGLVLKDDNVFYEASYQMEKGKIIKSDPFQYKDLVPPGSEISVVVSSGPPEDSKKFQFNIVISPAKHGQTSDVKIVYSDARGENMEAVSQKISRTESFPVTVVLAPDSVARIMVMRDKQLVDAQNISYEDVVNGSASGTLTVPGEEPETTPTPTPDQTPEASEDIQVHGNNTGGNGSSEDGNEEEGLDG